MSAEQGNSLTMNSVGYCCENGLGTDVNKTKAFEWYEKSANLGYCSAMYNVGNCYMYIGRGVTNNLSEARAWYTKAAAQGDTDAQTELDKLNVQ